MKRPGNFEGLYLQCGKIDLFFFIYTMIQEKHFDQQDDRPY